MAEGMDVDPGPVVRDKKRFEVKKVRSYQESQASPVLTVLVHVCSGMLWHSGLGVCSCLLHCEGVVKFLLYFCRYCS